MKIPKVVNNATLLAAVAKVSEKSKNEKSLQSSFTQVDFDDAFFEETESKAMNQTMALDISHMTGIDRTPSFHSECNSIGMMPDLGFEKQEDIKIFATKRPKPVEKAVASRWSNALALGVAGLFYVSKKIIAKKCFAAL